MHDRDCGKKSLDVAGVICWKHDQASVHGYQDGADDDRPHAYAQYCGEIALSDALSPT
jgi:hypothetical protein